MTITDEEFWQQLRTATQARIGLGRSGDALATTAVLQLRAAHATARDAVHVPLDVYEFNSQLESIGVIEPIVVQSQAIDRSDYLRRPDLGRKLKPGVEIEAGSYDVAIVLADGLSPRALTDHATGLLRELIDQLPHSLVIAPIVVATQARVGLGDEIAERLEATTVIVVIGERPGLSVADSLGIYLTYNVESGRRDSERNCVSNIHPPDGLSYERAAAITVALLRGAQELGRSGVDLKDTSSAAAVNAAESTALPTAGDPDETNSTSGRNTVG